MLAGSATSVTTPKKFTQKKVKVSSQGLFFNTKELEMKILRSGENKISFFRPFNSTFEREAHVIAKQKRNFNKDAGMKATSFDQMIPREKIGDNKKGARQSMDGPVGHNKFLENAITDVISGPKALKMQM